MYGCEAWELVGQCFDEITFKCTNFHGLSQIIATLTRENIAEREAAVHNLPWTQIKDERHNEYERLSRPRAEGLGRHAMDYR